MAASDSSDDSIEVFMQISPEMHDRLQLLSEKLNCEVAQVVALGINLLGVVSTQANEGDYLGLSQDKEALDSVIELDFRETDS